MITSLLDMMNVVSGNMLIKKASLIEEIMCSGKLVFLGMLIDIMITGVINAINIIIRDVVIRFITFIWSCTKFLVPKTNGLLLSYKS